VGGASCGDTEMIPPRFSGTLGDNGGELLCSLRYRAFESDKPRTI